MRLKLKDIFNARLLIAQELMGNYSPNLILYVLDQKAL